MRGLRRFGGQAVTDPDRARLRRRRQLQRRRAGVYSDRRLAELEVERAARAEAVRLAGERDGWQCQARAVVPEVGCGGGLDGHEPLTRARGGDPLDPDQIVTVCRFHHDWIGREQHQAWERGLLRHSWEGPIER